MRHLAWPRVGRIRWRELYRDTIIFAVLRSVLAAFGMSCVAGRNVLWTWTSIVDPGPPIVVGVVVTVMVYGDRVLRYVCNPLWFEGDKLVVPWTIAQRAPSCARSDIMLYCQIIRPNSIVPKIVAKNTSEASANSTMFAPESFRRKCTAALNKERTGFMLIFWCP